MRTVISLVGLFVALQGALGAVDHLFGATILGFVFNFFNRVVLPQLGFLAGYELFANLVLAAIGVIIMVAAQAVPVSRGGGT